MGTTADRVAPFVLMCPVLMFANVSRDSLGRIDSVALVRKRREHVELSHFFPFSLLLSPLSLAPLFVVSLGARFI